MNTKNKLKVIGWTRYSDEYRIYGESNPDSFEQAELVVMNEIKRRKYKFGGNYHQYGPYGCPVMSDGSVFLASMRHWGGMMATVWGGSYVDYAWSSVDDIKGGKAPDSKHSAKAVVRTKQEMLEIEEQNRKAREEAEREIKKIHRKQAAERRENKKILHEYLLKVVSKYNDNADALAKFLTKDIIGICDRFHCKPMNCGMKWVLYKSERNRVNREAEKYFYEMVGIASEKKD